MAFFEGAASTKAQGSRSRRDQDIYTQLLGHPISPQATQHYRYCLKKNAIQLQSLSFVYTDCKSTLA
jgi:hypothetical protein